MAPISHAKLPEAFVWPERERPAFAAGQPLNEPVIDLAGFLAGDEGSTQLAAELISSACRKHGFFQVINHGVDAELTSAALHHMDEFFRQPQHEKKRVRGFSDGHSHRFASKLPWKETLSFPFHASDPMLLLDHFQATMGHHSFSSGVVFKEYCESMTELSLKVSELLAISLGLERLSFRRFFEDSSSIMRCNYYPACEEPGLTLGTGPHCDPTSLTILHQDHVGGLEVFADGKWHLVSPTPGALVVNIGDTFMALTNGKYKSCLHRAVVKKESERRSLAFFLCPSKEKTVRPPEELVRRDGRRRAFPDFTWAALFDFTQKNYRADMNTLDAFSSWILN
ncbi:Gibberellin 20 oxidase 3 [Nymphaea thermarum]|nr:Gibberellin 20 oxidase 3 [Nymphaea thermarum]